MQRGSGAYDWDQPLAGIKGELLIWCGVGGGSHRFVLSVEVAFYHPGGVGGAVWCSGVQYSTQPSSRSLQRLPEKYEHHGHTWLQSLHLFLTVPQLREKRVKNLKCMVAISLFSCCKHIKNCFMLVLISSSLLVVFQLTVGDWLERNVSGVWFI